jgi:hypothetical protein
MKQTQLNLSVRSKSLKKRQLLFIWGFPWGLLIPTVVVGLFIDLGRISSVAFTSLIHGVLLLSVVIWNFICFLGVTHRLRKALSTARREMGGGPLVVQMSHKLQTSELRTALLFVPFIVSWTVPTYLSFSIAFSSAKEPEGVIWAFAILTPIYAFLVCLLAHLSIMHVSIENHSLFHSLACVFVRHIRISLCIHITM